MSLTAQEIGRRIVIRSALEHAQKLRALELKCRNAYPNGATLNGYTTKLADAHAAAAKIYEELLASEGER